MKWQTVWSADVGERHVEVRLWPTGEVRVNTARVAQGSGAHPITLHANNPADMERTLTSEGGFTPQEAKDILSQIPWKGASGGHA